MQPESKAIFEEFCRISRLAAQGTIWPTGYIQRVREFISSTDFETRIAAVWTLKHALIWRHTVAKLPRSIRMELISEMTALDGFPEGRLLETYFVRAYLDDDSLVDTFDGRRPGKTVDDYQWCRILGWLPSTAARTIVEGFLESEDQSIVLRAALSLAMNGKDSGEHILYANFRRTWEIDACSLEVAAALARLGHPEGIAFMFENLSNNIRSERLQLGNLVANIKSRINQFEEVTDFDNKNWFALYLAKILRRVSSLDETPT